jgi:hypothetical protein
VPHVTPAQPFRVQFSPERLKQIVQPFADKTIDYGPIATEAPAAGGEAMID